MIVDAIGLVYSSDPELPYASRYCGHRDINNAESKAYTMKLSPTFLLYTYHVSPRFVFRLPRARENSIQHRYLWPYATFERLYSLNMTSYSRTGRPMIMARFLPQHLGRFHYWMCHSRVLIPSVTMTRSTSATKKM